MLYIEPMGAIADLVWQYNCVHVYTRTLNVKLMLLNTCILNIIIGCRKLRQDVCACVTVKNKDH